MMSQPDFVALASAILETKASVSHEEAAKLCGELINKIATACMGRNPRFNFSRFLAACEGAVYRPPPRRRQPRGFTASGAVINRYASRANR